MQYCAAIDLDECLASLGPEFAKTLKRVVGVDIPHSEWHTHDWCSMFGVSKEMLKDLLNNHFDYRVLPLLSKDWVPLVHMLQRIGIKPLFVTARGNVLSVEKAKRVSCEWLLDQGLTNITEDDIIPTLWGQSKAKTLKSLGWEVVFSADDYHAEVLDYKIEYPHAYNVLIDSPIRWNSKISTRGIPCFDPRSGIGTLRELLRQQLLQRFPTMKG